MNAYQRFTLAHELGHLLLGHRSSFDILDSIDVAGRLTRNKHRPVEEVAADTFASELLGHVKLVYPICKSHQWNRQLLGTATTSYQLSLRLGISFEATCWALVAQGALDKDHVKNLSKAQVKPLKIALVSAEHLQDSWADVWNLTRQDTAAMLEAGPNDIFRVELHDYASAGYIWELVDAGPDAIVLDDLTSGTPTTCTSPVSHATVLRFQRPGRYTLTFAHRRPWNAEQLERIELQVSAFGKELGGFPRQERERRVGVEAA